MIRCPNCGCEVTTPQESKAQKHYAIIAKYADGTRSLEQIADAINADPDFAALKLLPKKSWSMSSYILQAQLHGYPGARSNHRDAKIVYKRDAEALWKEWQSGTTQKAIAQRLGVSQTRVGQILHRYERQHRLGPYAAWR